MFLVEWGGQEYFRVRRSWTVDEKLPEFFGSRGWRMHSVPNTQALDLPGLQARLLSSSYLPGPRDPRHESMLAAAKDLFQSYQRAEVVKLDYETRLYLGEL